MYRNLRRMHLEVKSRKLRGTKTSDLSASEFLQVHRLRAFKFERREKARGGSNVALACFRFISASNWSFSS